MQKLSRSTAETLSGGVRPNAMGSGPAIRHGGPAAMPPATRVDALLNGGVQQGSMEQALQPFMGPNALPTGQIINVSMNAPNPNLEFKEWMARGVVGGIGKVAAWPFRLVGMTLESAALAVVDVLKTILKWVLIAILAPTVLLMGYRLMQKASTAESIEGGSQMIVQDGRHVVNGIGKGLTSDLPPEKAPARPHKETPAER